MQEKYVILYGCVSDPKGDEVKGYVDTAEQAERYCAHKNMLAPKDHAYFSEPAKKLEI